MLSFAIPLTSSYLEGLEPSPNRRWLREVSSSLEEAEKRTAEPSLAPPPYHTKLERRCATGLVSFDAPA
jgi:hypothetical protein